MFTSRTMITVTPLFPGSLFPEEGSPVEISNSDVQTALDAVEGDGWFALEVATRTQKRWEDGDGGELWLDTGNSSGYHIYSGEELTVEDVQNLNDGRDYSILLTNMRVNSWHKVVRTRRGNFQPLEPNDVVI